MSDFNLFIYKMFSSSDLIQFHLYLILKKKLFTLIVSKELQNFNLAIKIIFTCFYHKGMNFYNFIYKSIFIHFHLKKVIYTNNFFKKKLYLQKNF